MRCSVGNNYDGMRPRKGSLLKSMQDHVVETGFIYSNKEDNLTISKDILYENSSSPLSFKQAFRNMACAR